MVMARVVEFVKRASLGFLSFCKDTLRIYCLLVLLQVPLALCASTAQVYEIGDDVPGGNENLMWIDHNPYFDAAMALFNIVDTEEHDEYYLLPYCVVVFFLAFFIRHNPVNHTLGRIDVDTIHHDVLTRALQWVNDKLEEEGSDLSSVATFFDSLVAFRDESTVELDQVVELSDPYDITLVPAQLYGFSNALEGDLLVDDSGFLAPYGVLMLAVGSFATDSDRDATSEFRRQLTLIGSATRVSFSLPAGAVPADRLAEFFTSAAYPFAALPSLLFFIPQQAAERRLLVRVIQMHHQGKEDSLIFASAATLARNDTQFGTLVGEATGYSSTGLRRILTSLLPDVSTFSLANLFYAQAQLSLRYSATIGGLGDESTVQERFQTVVDAIVADADVISRDSKGGSVSSSHASSSRDEAIKGTDLVAKILRNSAFLSLEKAVERLDKLQGDYKVKALQLCLAARIPFIYQLVAHRHQSTVEHKHHIFLSEIQSCSASVGIALTRILYPTEPASVFADAGLSSKVVASILRGEPSNEGLPARITPATSLFNLLIFPLEDIIHNKHRQAGGAYKFQAKPFSECYTLINITLFASKMELLFKALKVPAPSLTPATELYIGYDSLPLHVKSLVFGMVTRMMHAMELRIYRFLYDLAHGDALHYQYPSVVALDDDAVSLIEKEHKEAMQERRRYLRVFAHDPLDRAGTKRSEPKGPGLSNPGTPVEPGSRKELIKKWTADEFTFATTTYSVSDLRELYDKTKADDAPPFKDMCLPAGCCFAQGESMLMACQQYGTAGHESVTSKYHAFPSGFRDGVRALGKSTSAPGSRGRGKGRGRGRGRGKEPAF